MSANRDRYGRPAFRRTALAPGLLAAVAMLGGIALIESEAFLVFRFIVSILALVILVFAFQAKHWWWIPVMLAIAIVWNPVYPLDISGPWWVGAQYVAILLFVLAGVFIKVPNADEKR
jgi:hypothetical protein